MMKNILHAFGKDKDDKDNKDNTDNKNKDEGRDTKCSTDTNERNKDVDTDKSSTETGSIALESSRSQDNKNVQWSDQRGTDSTGTCSSSRTSSDPKNRYEKSDPTVNQLSNMLNCEYTDLGKTGLRVSRICLGTMTFGEINSKYGERPGQVNEAEAHKIIDRYIQLGGNFIDTADFFPWFGSCGESERIIGSYLNSNSNQRNKLIITTKIGMPTDLNNPNEIGLSRNHILNAVDRSLERLQTNYIDILQVTLLDNNASFSDLINTLNELVKARKVNYIGLSDVKPYQVQKLVDLTKAMSAHRISVVQAEYNLITRGVEYELTEICQAEKLAFLAYAPLKNGFLTNNFTAGEMSTIEDKSRIESASRDRFNLAALSESFEQMKEDRHFNNLMEVLEKIAKKKQRTVAQVAINWVLQRNQVTSIVIGCSTVQQLEENMDILNVKHKLSQSEMHELNEASFSRFPYPYGSNLASDVNHYLHRRSKKYRETLQTPIIEEIQPGMSQKYQQPAETDEQREAERLQFEQFEKLDEMEQQHPESPTTKRKHHHKQVETLPEQQQQQQRTQVNEPTAPCATPTTMESQKQPELQQQTHVEPLQQQQQSPFVEPSQQQKMPSPAIDKPVSPPIEQQQQQEPCGIQKLEPTTTTSTTEEQQKQQQQQAPLERKVQQA